MCWYFFVFLKFSVPFRKFVRQQGFYCRSGTQPIQLNVLDTCPVIVKLTTYIIHRLNNCTFVLEEYPCHFMLLSAFKVSLLLCCAASVVLICLLQVNQWSNIGYCKTYNCINKSCSSMSNVMREVLTKEKLLVSLKTYFMLTLTV